VSIGPTEEELRKKQGLSLLAWAQVKDANLKEVCELSGENKGGTQGGLQRLVPASLV
jgi:hypothetical protein